MFNFERMLIGSGPWRGLQHLRDRRHAQARVVSGRRIGCKQLIWDKVAQMRRRIEAAELLTYRAATFYDAGAQWITCRGIDIRALPGAVGAGEVRERRRLFSAGSRWCRV